MHSNLVKNNCLTKSTRHFVMWHGGGGLRAAWDGAWQGGGGVKKKDQRIAWHNKWTFPKYLTQKVQKLSWDISYSSILRQIQDSVVNVCVLLSPPQCGRLPATSTRPPGRCRSGGPSSRDRPRRDERGTDSEKARTRRPHVNRPPQDTLTSIKYPRQKLASFFLFKLLIFNC